MKICFIINPEGKPLEHTISTDFKGSMQKLIEHWLPKDVFGRYDAGSPWSYGIANELWKSMKSTGWNYKILEFDLEEVGDGGG